MNKNGEMPPLAILAGGLATRLQPLTESLPKSMLEVAGEPFVAHQLRLLHRQKIFNIVICAGFLADVIRSYVGTGEDFGVNVRYSLDGESLLGTGGAIKQALPLLGERFFVMYGDSYLPIAFAPIYKEFCKAAWAQGMMTVFRNEGKWDNSNVTFNGGRISDYDKHSNAPDMHYIDYGLGLFTATAFDAWNAGAAFDLVDVYKRLLKQNQLAGYEVSERFYEIGSPQGLRETSAMLASMSPYPYGDDQG